MRTTVVIQNLKCGGCENTIKSRLTGLGGVSEVTVDHERSSVSFTYVSEDRMERAFEELSRMGYPVVGDPNTLGKKVKSYMSCAVGRIKSSD